jgi:transposase
MANRLKMAEHNAILGLARLGWSFRRIAAEVGVDRETVARHVRAARVDPPGSNAAISITGSDPPALGAAGQLSTPEGTGPPDPNAAIPIPGSAGQRSRCEPFRALILVQLELGLTAQRIWQDLTAEHGFAGSYQSVQRFVKRLRSTTPLPFRRMECGPGEEAQVDFGRGAPLVTPAGQRSRPHLFRVVLSCSRKAYSEVVARQTTAAFLNCLENAFWYFGGVPKLLVTDNLKAAVIHADWYDPELNPKIEAFCQHYGTTLVPTRPRTPRHKGKVERGVGYAQSNALQGRTFDSLAAQNRFLAEWETGVADTRIHGTTRQQVGQRFTELEGPALLPLPAGRFPFFQEAERIVNRDGHVEVAKAYYSAPPEFVGRKVWVRWDGHVVRVFDRQLQQIAIHAEREPGRFATAPQHIAPQKRSGIERGTVWWLRKAHTIGPEVGRWAETVLQQRGIHSIRVIMGLVSLAQRHRDTELEQACRVARSHAAFRLRDVRNLLKRQVPPQEQFEFTQEHPLIRSLADYGALVHNAFEETPI